MIAAIPLARREEKRFGKETCQIIKVVDKLTGKGCSSSALTCKTPTMQEESIETKVIASELEFISSEFQNVSTIGNCSNIKENINPVMDDKEKLLSLVSVGCTIDEKLVDIPCLQSDEEACNDQI